MVGSDGRSKEAVGMLALHEALRNVVFLNPDWTYSVFWTIRPRPRCRGGNGCKVGDDNGSLMLMWEDGFCGSRADELGGEDPVQKAFSKMSIQLYNYGEGLMGKVASDKCHKWVFKEPSETEPNISNYWQSSFDALPPEWNDQFASGIQTIAVIQAGHGLLQLGSCKIIPEDLHFILRMRYMFESLANQSGVFLSQLFSSTRSSSSASPSAAMKQIQPLPFNLSHHSLPPIAPHGYHPAAQIGSHSSKDDSQMFFLPPNSSEGQIGDASLLSVLGHNALQPQQHHASRGGGAASKKVEGSKFKRSLTMPARVNASSSSSSSAAAAAAVAAVMNQQYHGLAPQAMDYRSSDAGAFQDIMGTFLE